MQLVNHFFSLTYIGEMQILVCKQLSKFQEIFIHLVELLPDATYI